MNPRVIILCAAILLASTTASAQSTDTTSDSPRWHGTMSLSNVFDGNINHDVDPIRSYSIVPAAEVVFQSSNEPAFAFGYEIASNRYTGTDEWDRISHSMYSVWSVRLGSCVRFEAQGSASWKGSSEDRELATSSARRSAWRSRLRARPALPCRQCTRPVCTTRRQYILLRQNGNASPDGLTEIPMAWIGTVDTTRTAYDAP